MSMNPESHERSDHDFSYFVPKDGIPTIGGKPHEDFNGPSTTTNVSEFDSPKFVDAQDKLIHVNAVEAQLEFFVYVRRVVLGEMSEVRESIQMILEETKWELVDWDLKPETIIGKIERVDADSYTTALPMAIEVSTNLTLKRRGVTELQPEGPPTVHHRRPKRSRIVHFHDGSWLVRPSRKVGATEVCPCSFVIYLEYDIQSRSVLVEVTDVDIEGFST